MIYGDFEDWTEPHVLPRPGWVRRGILWEQIEDRMPLEKAHELMNDAGFAGAFLEVRMDSRAGERLYWKFFGYDNGTSLDWVVAVDVLMGNVMQMIVRATA